ncbi:MAG: cyclic nucleotide-binding domain-containing protein [Chloroflexi bacterium]|nr:cyclic nucleotide-binding domain-containing protein [Chloroflexota bacterium]
MKLMTIRDFEAGTTIVSQGASAVTLYLILDGRVEVVREPEEGESARTALATLGPGEVFGEMALLDDEARSSSIVAVTPTRCALLSRWEFRDELQKQPRLAMNLLRMLSQRVRELDERLLKLQLARAAG